MKNINDLIEALQDAVQAQELLKEIFAEVGGYGNGILTEETRKKINDYFHFDDSE
jgi:hypothetical protein